MKKVVCLITAIMLCISLASFAFADADVEFVPSISYKGAPEVVGGGTINDPNGTSSGEVPMDHLLITPLAEAETSTKIPAEARDELLYVYDELNKGNMKLPYSGEVDASKMIVRDLFDVSWICDDGHKELVALPGVTVTLTFDIGIPANTDVVVMTYINGTWSEIVSVKNNGDGTITCVFEDFCPVAISVPVPDGGSSDTGDKSNITLWVVLLAVSSVAVVAMVVLRRRELMK
ncbi:MAG: hypothetical protein E7448_03510 [Ruminococcaceae bacterium]|nr:hypothetical protein [Oscillospiraceae bacterium]